MSLFDESLQEIKEELNLNIKATLHGALDDMVEEAKDRKYGKCVEDEDLSEADDKSEDDEEAEDEAEDEDKKDEAEEDGVK